MSEPSPEEKIAALEKELQDLKLAALEKEFEELRQAAANGESPDLDRLTKVQKGLSELRENVVSSSSSNAGSAPSPDEAAEAAPAPPPPPPEPCTRTDFEPFPPSAAEAIGVDGLRCAILFYAYDGIPKVEALLETFEDGAAEFAASGCALVAVRKVDPTSFYVAKAAEYAERFPSFNFVEGLEELAPTLSAGSAALSEGLGADGWARTLYYEPLAVLLEPSGGMRLVLSHNRLSALNLLGRTLRELHLAVPNTEGRPVSAAEAEANRIALAVENVQWAEVLKEDESLRQPTRYWFDGVFVDRKSERPLLQGVDAAALPEAIEEYLAASGEGEDDDEEVVEDVVSKDGVKAPAWYSKAKRTAEKKQEEEKLLWNGTAPSASAGPLPLGPSGARFAPVRGYAKKALKEAGEQQKALVQAFFRQYGIDELDFLPSLTGGDDADAEASATGGGGGGAGDGVAAGGSVQARETGGGGRSAATESALVRAQMLALGLSRSSTSGQSTRRLRLLRELEASVKELQAVGFRVKETLAKLKAQVKESYASAPQEFIDEARKADLLNEALPPLTAAEIAAEFVKLAESGKTVMERAAATPDFASLSPLRPRGPRPKGNKIDLKKPGSPPGAKEKDGAD